MVEEAKTTRHDNRVMNNNYGHSVGIHQMRSTRVFIVATFHLMLVYNTDKVIGYS